jgi:hypothetical protein
MKPYKFSKEAGRYIPTTKKGNRKFYYKRLSKLVECDFDPQSTFGKCIMKRLLGKLRFQRRCEKELSSYNFDLERKKESLNEKVKEFESKTCRNYKFEINKTAEEQANSEKWYLKPFKFIPLIVTVSYFIFFLQLNSPFEAVFFSAIIIYFFIRYPIKNHYDNVINKYEHKARENYQKKKPDELIREFKVKKENEIKGIRDQIKISQAKLENVKSSIKNTFYEIISIDKIEFILSDDFYRSTNWITIRNRVLNTHPNFCVKCKTNEDLTVDHIQPRSKYPELALEISNTQILCRSCNSSKGNRIE